MRTANVVVSVLGLSAVAVGLAMAWRWRHLPLLVTRQPMAGRTEHTADAVRTLGGVLAAGAVAGILVLGFFGRLVMRALAATSGERAQGLATEAEETVGQITTGGTIGFVIFVGLGGGVISALGFLLARRWLPRQAGAAGLVAGVLLVGTLGVADPFSPENVDFAILGPRWLAILLVVGTGMMFAATFTALAARLERTVTRPGWRRWVPCTSLIVTIFLPVALFAVVYVGGRTLAAGRAGAWLTNIWPRRAGHAIVGAATAVTAVIAVTAAIRIATI